MKDFFFYLLYTNIKLNTYCNAMIYNMKYKIHK